MRCLKGFSNAIYSEKYFDNQTKQNAHAASVSHCTIGFPGAWAPISLADTKPWLRKNRDRPVYVIDALTHQRKLIISTFAMPCNLAAKQQNIRHDSRMKFQIEGVYRELKISIIVMGRTSPPKKKRHGKPL